MTLATRNAGTPGLHVRYEKAGLILDQLPIPWNADAVVVEANVRLPVSTPREKQQFTLHLSNGSQAIAAELLRQESKDALLRVFFRIAVPAQSCQAQVFWREHSLGQTDLPLITSAEFVQSLALQMPTLHVGLGSCTIACQTFVNTQCQSLCASALLSGAGPLAPIGDLNLHVEVRRDDDELVAEVPVYFTSEQLRARQALLMVLLPKLRRIGTYKITWLLGQRRLHVQRVRTISKKKFLASLRISATRFVVQKQNGAISVVRWLPHHDHELSLEEIARIGPCFFVCSSEAGMAGLAAFTVQTVVEGNATSPLTIEHEMLVTDGPMPLLPGTLEAEILKGVKHFTLASSTANLGVLPLLPAPTAQFTAEGGFAPLDDFLWSPAAEEQLNDRLGKLLGS